MLCIFNLNCLLILFFIGRYVFPKQLLTSHFWSLQQRTQFAVNDQKARLHHYKPVFRLIFSNNFFRPVYGASVKFESGIFLIG